MRPFTFSQRITIGVLLVSVVACHRAKDPDAYGNFEADEVSVSAQASGQLTSFTPVEGAALRVGEIVGVVDTTQLALERAQLIAQQQATAARVVEAGKQVEVYQAQLGIALRNYERMQRLFEEKAATVQQRDQAERDYRTLVAQIGAAKAQQQSVSRDATSSGARVAQINDQIAKSKVINPEAGTVLATYVKTGEVVQSGEPLYKIADVDTLILRAYITEKQLSGVKLGQQVQVHVDQGGGKLLSVSGTVRWISTKAEFTPTPVQTRDERADLVYAMKVYVPNPKGALKIGMPADLTLGPVPAKQPS
ncbi:MAG TPA: HlyD family efflux transporter periplasmic adaptor subunit [Gemmatimonadaceae bacterium]